LPRARPNFLYEAPAKQALEHNIKIMEELDRVKILDEAGRTNLREMRVQLEQVQAAERNRDEGCSGFMSFLIPIVTIVASVFTAGLAAGLAGFAAAAGAGLVGSLAEP
jgi:predicted phage tail protein